MQIDELIPFKSSTDHAVSFVLYENFNQFMLFIFYQVSCYNYRF